MPHLTILFVSDLCGKPGRQAAAHLIKPLREEYQIDYVITNIENAAGGFGITPEMSRKVFSYGVDVQTSGNHIWDRVDILEYIESEPRLLRPANYPYGVPGNGSYIGTCGDHKIGVINLMGRVYMNNIDCPFRVGAREVEQMRKVTPIIVVDFHAEATSEKQAMFFYLDGRVSAVLGTHTHVQTVDDQISKRGTGYITDAGMTGPYDSVIGMDKGPSLGRFLTGMPKRFTTATGDVKLAGVLLKVNSEDGSAVSIDRLMINFDLKEHQNKGNADESNEE
ncbi:MAG: TIGR00282 family metallophosphoesterase [Candidatus Zixiibacteriota bacterium]|jgi:hypothetical protein